MFDYQKARECLRNVVGFQNHFDPSEIPPLPTSLTQSISNEYYNRDFHSAIRLDNLKRIIPPNQNFVQYLTDLRESVITQALNDIAELKKLNKVGKELISSDIIQRSGFIKDLIPNNGRFVGIAFRPSRMLGVEVAVQRIALQLSHAQTSNFQLYVYHESSATPIQVYGLQTSNPNVWNWKDVNFEMTGDEMSGLFYIGYYQDDLTGNAIKYSKLNWTTGYCGTCDGGVMREKYTKTSKFVGMRAFYVPAPALDPNREIFDPESVIFDDETNFGFNLHISTKCNVTSVICSNKMTLKNVLGYKMACKVLEEIKMSTQFNSIEEKVRMMIIRDLEGDSGTGLVTIPKKYENALKSANFDFSNISHFCLPESVNAGLRHTYH